jgi:beta-lactamase class A
MSAGGLTRELRGLLADAGLSGSFLIRELATGEEIGIDPDAELPIASLVKVPLAVAVLGRIQAGQLDGSLMIDVPPAPAPAPAAGSAGLSRFRHPARIAVDDLLYLSTAMTDNTAADILFGLVPPAEVSQALHDAGIAGISIRHAMRELSETPVQHFGPDETHLAHSLAIGSRTAGGGHPVPQLDISRASSGSARALTDLLQALWLPSRIPAPVAAQVRALMAQNTVRHRLSPDFASDASTWSSKTGTLLNLRHEIGVAEHDDGGIFAVAALTESAVPAATQPAAEAVMARVARALHDHLRGALP